MGEEQVELGAHVVHNQVGIVACILEIYRVGVHLRGVQDLVCGPCCVNKLKASNWAEEVIEGIHVARALNVEKWHVVNDLKTFD